MRPALYASIGVAWASCGPFLARAMRGRGRDGFSWFAIGSVLGPAALVLAGMERRSRPARTPEIVAEGADLGGEANVLLSIDAGEGVADVARPLIDALDGHVGRITVVGVLPEGRPKAALERAKHAIAREVAAIPGAEGVLAFGRPDRVLRAKATEDGFHFVVSARMDDRISRAFADGRVHYFAGRAGVHYLGCAAAARTTRH